MRIFRMLIILSVLIFIPGEVCAQIELEIEEPANVEVKIVLTEDGVEVQPSLDDGRELLRRILVIRDGFYGRIYLGKRLSEIDYFRSYLVRERYFTEPFAMKIKDIRAYIKLTPRIFADYIEMKLTPALRCISDKREDIIDLRKLSVTVIVRSGMPVNATLKLKAKMAELYKYFFVTEEKKAIEVTLVPSILEYGGVVE